jgi:coenzyme PQQ precursor peptide PqqA
MFKRITEILIHAIILLHTKNLYATFRRNTMWTTPSAQEMRFGFEVTMYVMNK